MIQISTYFPVKVSRRRGKNFGKGFADKEEKTEVADVEQSPRMFIGRVAEELPIEEEEESEEDTISRVKREMVEPDVQGRKVQTRKKSSYTQASAIDPKKTLELQNKQVLGEWTWLRNMVANLPNLPSSIGGMLRPEPQVQPLRLEGVGGSQSATVLKDPTWANLDETYSPSQVEQNPTRLPSSQQLTDDEIVQQLLGESNYKDPSLSPASGSSMSPYPQATAAQSSHQESQLPSLSHLASGSSSSLPQATTYQAASNSEIQFNYSNDDFGDNETEKTPSSRITMDKNGITTLTRSLKTHGDTHKLESQPNSHSTKESFLTNNPDTSPHSGESTTPAGLNTFVNSRQVTHKKTSQVKISLINAYNTRTKRDTQFVRYNPKKWNSDVQKLTATIENFLIGENEANNNKYNLSKHITDLIRSNNNISIRERIPLVSQQYNSHLDSVNKDEHNSFRSHQFSKESDFIPLKKVSLPVSGYNKNSLRTQGQTDIATEVDSQRTILKPDPDTDFTLKDIISSLELPDLKRYANDMQNIDAYADALITDDVSVGDLKEAIHEAIESRNAPIEPKVKGLSIPRQRPTYGDEGFVVLVSPLKSVGQADRNKVNSQASDLNALAQQVGHMAATNFLKNYHTASGLRDSLAPQQPQNLPNPKPQSSENNEDLQSTSWSSKIPQLEPMHHYSLF